MDKKQFRYILGLSAVIFFTQGITSLVSQPLYYYLKEVLGIAAGTVMMLSSLTSLPWMIKPLYGLLSDNIPLFGYKRKSYMILSAAISLAACLTLGLSATLPLTLLFTLMIIDSLSSAVKNVAVDGLMVEEGQKYNLTGKIQSVQWGSLYTAVALCGVVGGYISEKADYHLAYLIISVFPLLVGSFAFCYKEEKAPIKKLYLKETLLKYVNALKNKSFVLSTLFLFFLWFSPSIGTPIMVKMRDELHFSKIWIGWLDTIGAICGVIGALLYYRVSQGINIRKWLILSIILGVVSTLAYLHITPALILIYTVVFGLTGMFTHLAVMDYMAKCCPKGTEATTFALLCSVVNFSGFLSNIIGGKLYNFFGYNGLVWISGLTTLLCLGFIPWLNLNGKDKA